MPIDLFDVKFLAALALAALMGYAIQRGATCMVAAVDEIVTRGRATRLLAMLEASLWVAGGLLAASAWGWTPLMPRAHAIGWPIVAGGALLGLGALFNRACVFGAVARLGSGDWAYLATPLGYWLGCLAYQALPWRAPLAGAASPLLGVAGWASAPLAVFMAWRVGRGLWRAARAPAAMPAALQGAVWGPGPATVVIGIAFVLMLIVVGEHWAYTEVLAEFARGMRAGLPWRVLLLLALLGGALLGGYRAGRLRPVAPAPSALLRCLGGGAMMGMGSLLIPGSNDGLILLGMPLLLPHAWLAFLVMCVTIGGAMLLQARLRRP